ncbi:MAG: hypothetical protein HQL37_04225 [Alphaproteobacteria bacterium]|nr:hypothetical protein [Alphaproteobacteria bacterium]
MTVTFGSLRDLRRGAALGLCLIVLACLLFAAASSAQADDRGTPPGLPMDQAAAGAGVAVGNIHGVRLRIPNYYLASGLQYKGEEPLMMTPRTFTPTFESEIEYIGVRLRVSNLQPIRTAQDREDYARSRHTLHPFIYETWMTISYSQRNYGGGSRRGQVENWERDGSRRGPFVRHPELVNGLIFMESTQPVVQPGRAYQNGKQDYYYDESMATFISCEMRRQSVPPFAYYNSCNHYFDIPEIGVEAEAIYTTNDLPRWREIEARARELLQSFIVH